MLQRACIDKLREETAKYPEWQDFDDQTSGDGASTRPISSAGTPQPPQRSGFKLRLNGARTTSTNGGTASREASGSLAQSDDD